MEYMYRWLIKPMNRMCLPMEGEDRVAARDDAEALKKARASLTRRYGRGARNLAIINWMVAVHHDVEIP